MRKLPALLLVLCVLPALAGPTPVPQIPNLRAPRVLHLGGQFVPRQGWVSAPIEVGTARRIVVLVKGTCSDFEPVGDGETLGTFTAVARFNTTAAEPFSDSYDCSTFEEAFTTLINDSNPGPDIVAGSHASSNPVCGPILRIKAGVTGNGFGGGGSYGCLNYAIAVASVTVFLYDN